MTQTDLFNLQYAPGPKVWTGEGGEYTYSYYPFDRSFQSFSHHAPTKDGPKQNNIGENIFVLSPLHPSDRFTFSCNTNYCVKVGDKTRARAEMENNLKPINVDDLLKYKYSVSLSIDRHDLPKKTDKWSTESSIVIFQLKDHKDKAKSIVELYWIDYPYKDHESSPSTPLLLIKYFNMEDKPTEIIGPHKAFALNNKFNIDMYFDSGTQRAVLDIPEWLPTKQFISKYTYNEILGDNKEILFKTGNYNQLNGLVVDNQNKFSIISFYKMNISKI